MPSPKTLERREKWIENLSKSHKGLPSPRKGKHHTKEAKEKNRQAHVGKIPWIKGKHHTEEIKLKMRGRKVSIKTKLKLSESHKGNRHTERTKEKMSESRKGENNPNWHGGASFEPYGQDWKNVLKESIRLRDNYRCQICGVPQRECLESLSVHHKDGKKTNLNPDNLVSLCRNCHSKLHNNKDFATYDRS